MAAPRPFLIRGTRRLSPTLVLVRYVTLDDGREHQVAVAWAQSTLEGIEDVVRAQTGRADALGS